MVPITKKKTELYEEQNSSVSSEDNEFEAFKRDMNTRHLSLVDRDQEYIERKKKEWRENLKVNLALLFYFLLLVSTILLLERYS